MVKAHLFDNHSKLVHGSNQVDSLGISVKNPKVSLRHCTYKSTP